jgi:hypothetical protein
MAMQALQMRLAGASIRQIQSAVGFRTIRGCHETIRRMLDEHVIRPTQELRALEVQRLDALLLAVWPMAMGRRAQRDQPAVLPDPTMIDRALKILERRARLLGLDMPVQHELSGPNGAPLDFSAALAALVIGRASLGPPGIDPSAADDAEAARLVAEVAPEMRALPQPTPGEVA